MRDLDPAPSMIGTSDMCASSLNKPSSQEGQKLVERLKDGGIFGSQTWAEVEALCREAATLISELQAALYLEKNRADNLEQNYQEATTRHPSFNDAIEAAIKCVPTNWCDDLLTGPNAPRGPLGGPDVERLLLAIIERLRSLKLPDYRGGEKIDSTKTAESEHSLSTREG